MTEERAGLISTSSTSLLISENAFFHSLTNGPLDCSFVITPTLLPAFLMRDLAALQGLQIGCLLLRGDNSHRFWGDQEESCGELISEEPELHSVCFVETLGLITLAHDHGDAAYIAKATVATAFVGFPLRDERRQAVVEAVLVDAHLFRHRGR
ncbi:hypothetical protein KC366_g85 [Hortaea werneckii]|nr:hypothetical protein KC366_g85 [Hortaea werneckii]